MRSYVSVRSMNSSEKIHRELTDLVLEAASQILAESASNFERAIASRILGRKYENFKVLTVEDFLADIVCGGKRWKEYKKKLQHLGYMVELAPLVLYILVEEQQLEDAKELFDLVIKTEDALQKQGIDFTDIYVEIMKWIAKKMNLKYSPPKSYIKFSEDYSTIIRAVLNYQEIMNPQEILRVKHIAQQRISSMLSGNEIWDVRLLYFAWKLSYLFSPPQLPLKDQMSFIVWRRRKNLLIYHGIRFLPEILVTAGSIICAVLTKYVSTINIVAPLATFLLKHLLVKCLPQQVQKFVNRWPYYAKIKSKLEKDEQLIREFKKFISS